MFLLLFLPLAVVRADHGYTIQLIFNLDITIYIQILVILTEHCNQAILS